MTTETTLARYELMVVLKADRRDEEITKHLDSIKKHVEDHGGKFFHEDDWGKRDMAYRIKGQETGYYVVFGVEITPEHVKELNDLLRIDQMLLRYLLQKMPKGYELTKVIEADLDFSKKRGEEKEEEKPVKKEKPKKEEPKEEVVEEVEEEEVEEVVEEETPEEEPEVEESPEEEAPAEEEKEEVVEEEVEEEEAPVEEEKEEEATAKEEPKEEKKDEEKPKKSKKEDIDDLDKKLQAIMNDTDIDISL